jgi:hypothetical protein
MNGKYLKIEQIKPFYTRNGILIEPYLYESIYYVELGHEDELKFNNISYTIHNFDTTPPTLSPYAVIIPEIYQWAFPENKFVLSGFEIPLDNHNNDKVVNIAYFMWEEFRAELDSGNYEALKRALMPLWDYVELQVINNNLVIL